MIRTPLELELIEATAIDLPAIDLAQADPRTGILRVDRQTYEARFAELGFGLGTVARRQHRDDAWWETPLGMIACVVVILVALGLSIAG